MRVNAARRPADILPPPRSSLAHRRHAIKQCARRDKNRTYTQLVHAFSNGDRPRPPPSIPSIIVPGERHCIPRRRSYFASREIGARQTRQLHIIRAQPFITRLSILLDAAVLLARVSISFIGRPYRPLYVSCSFYFHPPSFVMRRTSKRDRPIVCRARARARGFI